MTHAIIILAHKNISQVAKLAGYFERDCDVFIHIDKKQKIEPSVLSQLKSMHQVQAQRERGIKRPIPDKFDHLYGGSQCFSITRGTAGKGHLQSCIAIVTLHHIKPNCRRTVT